MIQNWLRLGKLEDEDDISPPPFSILYIDVQTFSGKINPEDPVIKIKSRYEDATDDSQQNAEIVFDSNQEKDILSDFCNYVQD